MLRTLDTDKLHAILLAATERVIVYLKQVTQDEHLYTFGLYTNGEGTAVLPTANTEEALTYKAHVYADRSGKPVDQWRVALRWSPCDWGYHLAGQELFHEVERLLLAGWTDDYADYLFDRHVIYATCLDVLATVRQRGLFEEQDQVLLNLFMRDQSIEQRIAWAKLLNSEPLNTRFAAELVEGYEAFFKVSA